MASDGLLRCSNVAASCSSRSSHESLKASVLPYSSLLRRSSPKGLCGHQSLVARTTPSMKAICCQAITPFSKQEDHVSVNNCNIEEQQLFSPDRWIEDCVCDIVRNINEAPFLHMLFDLEDGRAPAPSQRLRVQEDGAMNERWKELKDCVSRASPDGVIFVNHLDEPCMEGSCIRDGCSLGIEKQRVMEKVPTTTKLWGILLLGKSTSRSACYMLKTTSVSSPFGSCTQFCLTKAKCFGPSWHEQMQSSWLLQTENAGHGNKGDV